MCIYLYIRACVFEICPAHRCVYLTHIHHTHHPKTKQPKQYTAIPDLAAIMDPAALASAAAVTAATAATTAMDMEGVGEALGAAEVALEAQAFYAIYDGHCGVRAARYARVRSWLA